MEAGRALPCGTGGGAEDAGGGGASLGYGVLALVHRLEAVGAGLALALGTGRKIGVCRAAGVGAQAIQRVAGEKIIQGGIGGFSLGETGGDEPEVLLPHQVARSVARMALSY